MARQVNQLQSSLAAKKAELESLTRERERLQARWATLHIAVRLQRELQQHHTSFEQQVSHVQPDLAANEQKPQNACGSIFNQGTSGSRSIGNGQAPPTSGPNGQASGGAGAAGLRLPPHLADGASLLQLHGVTREEVEQVRSLTPEAAKQLWGRFVKEGFQLLAGMEPTPAGPPGTDADALSELGTRMHRFMGLLICWNLDVYIHFMATRTDCEEAVAPGRDAPRSHWEKVVAGVGYTRAQALIVACMNDQHLARLAGVRAESAALLRQLSASDEGAAAAGFDLDRIAESEWLVEALEANGRSERAAIQATALIARAIHTPAQWCKVWLLAHPYPIHQQTCTAVLQHMLDHTPEALEESPA